MFVREVDTETEFASVIKGAGDRYVFVDFYAPWCRPCMNIAPVIERLAGEFVDLIYLKVDVDSVPELADEYAITTIPAFKIFESGNLSPVDEMLGASENKIRALLAKYSDGRVI